MRGRILAITFTNKSSGRNEIPAGSATGMSDRFPWVRTYHSTCFRIFEKHCQVLGFQPLQIYSEYQQQKIVKDILINRNIDKKYLCHPGAYFQCQKLQ
ncbi:MAG: hypothetical protein R2860_08185 [Desulfobacterales bacterium]